MIQFDALCAGYGGRRVLHGIDGRWPEGKLIGLIGPNGCGKTTLLRCAAGLLRPSEGGVRLRGRRLAEIPPKECALQVSYMPQSRQTPDISVGQLAAHGRYPHKKWTRTPDREDRRIVREALERTGLAEYADRSVRCLSGGERQRAYIAMMLAQQTPVMLLDEPTTYLDPAARFSLMELLRELRGDGRTVAVVLHDLSLAAEYADELWLMERGRLAASGTAESVCRSGEIQRVFGVNAERTPGGRYLFYGGKP